MKTIQRMRYNFKNGLFWLILFTLLALLPLGIARIGNVPEFRTFWIELGVALGFVGLALFGLLFLFSGRFVRIAPVFGMDNILNFHREIGILAFFLVLAHPVTLLIAEPEFLSYFDPSVNLPRALALSFVTVALIVILVTSIWRLTFGLSYEHWRLLHGFLALSIVFIGITHSIQVSHYLEPMWKKIAISALMGACMYLLIHTRLVRPWLNREKPYKITEVKEERGESWSLTLEPDGHKGMDLRAAQFAWLTIGPTPFTLQQHPFSLSSSPRGGSLTFTAKEEGDFTSTWKDMEPGTPAWLEGPYGTFTFKGDDDIFLIMGGIGVTPAMSMLRTIRDDKDNRKATLIYANESWEGVTFREELERLSEEIDLKVVHVLEDPPDEWEGETGFIDEELLEKYLPEEPNSRTYYICGPGPMMDIAESSLHNLGVRWNHIYTERFQIV